MKKLGITLLLFVHLAFAHGADSFLEFREMSPKGGFTFGSIHQITEDAYGFIWFGSHHGLFRYNTQTIDKFVHSASDVHSLPSNYISSITKDDKGTLWFATDNGICYFNQAKENFERCTFYDSDHGRLPNAVTQLIASQNQRLWVLSDRKLYHANCHNFSLERANLPPHDNLVSFIYVDKNQRLWAKSTSGMVYWADAPYTSFREFGTVTNQPIQTMLFTNHRLWIGYESSGAECYDIYGSLMAHYGRNKPDGYDIKSDRVRKIFEDLDGRIWLATYNGIAVLDKGKPQLYNDKNTRGLIHPSIYDIFMDSKKGIWVGTWSGTLSYANPYDNTFSHLNTQNGLSNNVVSAIAERQGIVWIGTEGGGLNSFNPTSKTVVKHTLNPLLNDEQNVKAIEVDTQHALWVGTFNDGLWVIRQFRDAQTPVSPIKVMQGGFYAVKKQGNYVWAASYYMGLFKIDVRNLEFENFRSNANVPHTLGNDQLRSLCVDSQGGIWIGTQNGLGYRKNADGKFVHYLPSPSDTNSVAGKQIYHIFEDSHQNVWVSTSSGLSRFNRTQGNFTSFGATNGIAGYEIYGTVQDGRSNLWVISDDGISQLNLKNFTWRQFNAADGLHGNQFNPGAVYRAASGIIYFGGPSGLTYFNPDRIKTNSIAPTPIVVGISINNQLQVPSDSLSVLQTSSLTLKDLKLKHDQNSVTFHFVANNYLSPQKNMFSYRLVNYDDKWINATHNLSATYTKIPPGKYTFQLRAGNNDGVWNTVPNEIEVTVLPPWWKSWWAYIVYSCALAAVIYFIQRERLIKQKLLNDVFMEKLKSQSEKELDDAKLTFFTNISHEIKTPLSLILSPLGMIMQKRKDDAELVDSLGTIQRNANRLKHLLHQVIDIRRIDAGKLDFHPVNASVTQRLHDLIACFSIEAREREIDFQYLSEFDKFEACIDPDKFDKIVFNLLSNAFKFVPDHGEVIASLSQNNINQSFTLGSHIEGTYMEISVSNSGSYVPLTEHAHIFERFVQGKEGHQHGTGIGLHMVREYVALHHGQIQVQSSETTGTCFTVRLPISANATPTLVKPTTQLPQPEETGTAPRLKILETDGKRKLILVVEDNPELRSFLRKSLSRTYTVITAPNGQKGIEQAIDINPDLIVSDVMMPVMDGLELCRRIKQDENTSHIPVVLLTALSSETHQIEGLLTGADAYVAKPFSESLLHSQIHTILLNRQKLKERFLDPDSQVSEGDAVDHDAAFISKAIGIVEEHLLNPNFSVETLAEQLRISRTSLHRKLKVHTDQSATEFIRFVRLKKALKMLKSGNYTIDEISYNVGFNTPSYFSQSFKKQFGKSPKEYLGMKD